MPGFQAVLENFDQSQRRASLLSQWNTPALEATVQKERGPVLFPAAFGVIAGEPFDDVTSCPPGLYISRIKSVTIHAGAWIDSIVTTYVLNDGSSMTCANGPKGARSVTYELEEHEQLLGIGGMLGFIKNTDFIVSDLMIEYLQLHIKDLRTGLVRVVPEDPESYTSSQGADFFVQGPILAFSGRVGTYLCQIQPYLTKEKDTEFGMPAPGVAFDDRKVCRKDPIKRIKEITVRAASWIEGLEVVYELSSGRTYTCNHGGTGGVTTRMELAVQKEDEIIEALSQCNSGPFPFVDSLRLYITRYGPDGEAISRRTIPDKSDPAFGYDYESGENLWIRTGKGCTVFAFAGKSGSYIEELACWVRDTATGEEKLVNPAKISSTPASKRLSTVSLMMKGAADIYCPQQRASGDEAHKRSFSTLDVPIPSSSLNVLPSGMSSALPGSMSFSASPELVLPSSVPSSPSLQTNLRRLSIASSSGDSGSECYSPVDKKRKRLSGAQAALKHGEEVQRLAKESQLRATLLPSR